ncbi:RicAFT regulatory complex protein RicA family protein [Anoxybacillus sp. LAT_35]|uniref:RicAFT regulatory complex protein RicA family protein n=1 Tax=Anoxybacillus TaxID=150247 RepID=UPI001EDB51D7|nr:RicAFT regulatory complex protein RicA family protein [Anoxybacillus sp. LAT_26]MCG3083562.1 RicAFT regulatory complex protein RicA family protein [Anoxybacillus sp. LAT27]MCG5025101.1 RicAFT regulatory complex protein RicA family protein [Anoxybacillus flavithermus]MCG6170335.1 RicAFT regulatory complex protein RicA family protein [Anoxybacillus sp. LAT_11]MCG6174866.1 RicAFT regulatory complex protein RicA family protein [Anoxybacillus sp. LAT_31]MCG6178490.1 RicAFT regulatory complex pro
MAKYTKDDIVQKAKELAKMIAETEEVEIFKQAEAKIHENEKVRMMIAKIKSLQKQAVNLQHYGKVEALKKVEAEIDEIYEQLSDIPIVEQFKQSQVEINDLLQLVASTISKTVTDEIITSTGGDVLRGETGAQVKHSHCGHCH